MIEKKNWNEFIDSGLLWFINTILHMFGWAITYELDSETKEIKNIYPARVKFRGFTEKINSEGYIKVTKFLNENISQLLKESEE